MTNTLLIEDDPQPLRGVYPTSPSPRVAQRLMVLSLLSHDLTQIEAVPRTREIDQLVEMLGFLGAQLDWVESDVLASDAAELSASALPKDNRLTDDLNRMLFITLLARLGESALSLDNAQVEAILPVLYDLKVNLSQKDGYLVATRKRTDPPVKLSLSPKSQSPVGVESALILASLLPATVSTIKGAIDGIDVRFLVDVLQAMGARIEIDESGNFQVEGSREIAVDALSVPFNVDEAVLMMVLVSLVGGELEITGVETKWLVTFLAILQQVGVEYKVSDDQVRVWRDDKAGLKPIELSVGDSSQVVDRWLPALMVLLSQADGVSAIQTDDLAIADVVKILKVSGAEVQTVSNEIKIIGPTNLTRQRFVCDRLDAGLAALGVNLLASGYGEISNFDVVEREFPRLGEKLQKVGAKFKIANLDGHE